MTRIAFLSLFCVFINRCTLHIHKGICNCVEWRNNQFWFYLVDFIFRWVILQDLDSILVTFFGSCFKSNFLMYRVPRNFIIWSAWEHTLSEVNFEFFLFLRCLDFRSFLFNFLAIFFIFFLLNLHLFHCMDNHL